jgi:hypothetical protein
LLKEKESDESYVILGALHYVKSIKGVDKIFFASFRFLLFIKDAFQLNSNIDSKSLFNILKIHKISRTSQFSKSIELFYIAENPSGKFWLLSQLLQIVEALLCHDGVVSFKSNQRAVVFNDSWNATPGCVASSSQALSYCEEAFPTVLGENRFHSTCEMMH